VTVTRDYFKDQMDAQLERQLQGHFGLALKLSIHLVLEVVAGHGHKVVNPFFELVEVLSARPK
jgi:hypothetical protein